MSRFAPCIASPLPRGSCGLLRRRADEAADLKGCKAGKASKCEERADKYLAVTARDKRDEALELRGPGGATSKQSPCNNVGTSWSTARTGGGDKDHASAQVLRQGVHLKNGSAASPTRQRVSTRGGVTRSPVAARELQEVVRTYDEARAARARHHVRRGKQCEEVKKAVELLEKACALKSEPACKNVEILKNQKPKPRRPRSRCHTRRPRIGAVDGTTSGAVHVCSARVDVVDPDVVDRDAHVAIVRTALRKACCVK